LPVYLRDFRRLSCQGSRKRRTGRRRCAGLDHESAAGWSSLKAPPKRSDVPHRLSDLTERPTAAVLTDALSDQFGENRDLRAENRELVRQNVELGSR